MKDKFNKIDLTPKPVTKNVSKDDLKLFLFDVMGSYWKRLFCWHSWVYWRFGNAGKLHRVCKKCGKKQQNINALNKENVWVKDVHF